jgi:arabinofuranan 3-O-arabinosyltransferase
VLLQGFDPYRIVLLDESATGVSPPHIDSLPPPMASRATVTHWEPGAMTVRMDPAPEHDAYLVVSENWYTDWRATVDGRSVTPLRGQGTLLTVPVPRGGREVTLSYSRDVYRTGRLMTLLSFAGIAAWLLVPRLMRRRSA